MDVSKQLNGSELFVEISGSIDSATSPELNDSLNESIKGISTLILDFRKVSYISSAGLRVLLATFKALSAKGGQMIVRNPNQNVMDIFTMTGFDNILTIENK